MCNEKREIKGTGILIPEDLWNAALPTMKKQASRVVSPEGRVLRLANHELIWLRLDSGEVIRAVVVNWDRELIHRRTDLPQGPEWTTEGLDFSSQDIVAIGVIHNVLGGLFHAVKWFER